MNQKPSTRLRTDDEVPALAMHGISKRFGDVHANVGVDLVVHEGEIHGLLGENGAGKTTLMKILYGLHQPDSGIIEIDGVARKIDDPADAVEAGVGMVHQHFMLIPDMTVAENVALGIRGDRYPLSDLRTVASRIRELSKVHGLKIDPDAIIEDLSVGARQRVEILKVLYRGARILVMDEPTAVLTPQEWQNLELILRSLANEGRSVIFITHKLDELLGIVDKCTVMRDGQVVGTAPVAEVDKRTLARLMVGREVVLRVEKDHIEPGEPVLEINSLRLEGPSKHLLSDVSMTVRSGEILGIAGVDGNGQDELVAILSGVLSATGGSIRVAGDDLPLDQLRRLRRDAGVITADRHVTGVALSLSVLENLLMNDFRSSRFSTRSFLRSEAMRSHAKRLMEGFDIRAPSGRSPVRTLSGGNQQKVVLARELWSRPKILIASQPTRGLDVGAMEYVYSEILEHRRRGSAILLVSTELQEILTLSDRIAVLYEGRLSPILSPGEADEEILGLLMSGQAA